MSSSGLMGLVAALEQHELVLNGSSAAMEQDVLDHLLMVPFRLKCFAVSSSGLVYLVVTVGYEHMALFAFTAAGEQVYAVHWQCVSRDYSTQLLPLPDGRVIVLLETTQGRTIEKVNTMVLLSPVSR
eukprot:TRINITY_DN14280_c0_g1_i1.p2 TRINITY_DN14280_c0_g1~~TRINITY_DN14280_c0_g1_i1.p2  ORF type:complete len:127 (+),score=4.27 TRINITY_DN14280_c0_g1_i1:561-941(+)